MPVSWVSPKAGIMSHFIIRSGPKYIPEGQTLSMTSYVLIHQHWAAIFLGQGRDASQPLAQCPLCPQKHTRFMLRAPRDMEVAAVPGQGMQIHPCHSFLPIHLLHKGKGLWEHVASCSHLPVQPPVSCPCGTAEERPLPTEQAQCSSWNAGMLLSALFGIKNLGFCLIFILFCLRWLTESS